MKLDRLEPGKSARVIKIQRGAHAEQRLLEMGIVPGVEVVMLARHPFQGPVIIKLDNSRLALGRKLAGAIEVEQIPVTS